MAAIKIINNLTEVDLYNKWTESTKFNGKNKLVNEHGKYVEETYAGRKYQLVSKREHDFHYLERIARVFLGTLAAVCTLGLLLFSKSVRNLFLEKKEKIRFAVLVPSKKHEDEYGEKELHQGIFISMETVSKILTCMKHVLERKEVDGVKLYNSQGNHRIFELDTAPGLIFKMKAYKNCYTPGKDDSMKARYQTMINAQTVLRTHQLGLLVLPHAKLFNVKADGEEYEIIAEQKLDINPNESAQEQYFEEYADSLNEAIRQLAIFICKTGYSDVEWRNNPVLNNSLGVDGNRKIALIDIEEMDSKETGLFGGGYGRTGLVGLVNEEQGKIVQNVAKQNWVSMNSFSNAHSKRKGKLEDNRKLKDYYARKNIIKGDETIHVDISSLGLDINRQGKISIPARDENGKLIKEGDDVRYEDKIVTLGEVTEYIVKEMNKLIQANDPQSSSKGRRYFVLNTNRSRLRDYNELGLPAGKFMITEKEAEERWLFVILQSLIAKGHIFKLDKVDGGGYYVQA